MTGLFTASWKTRYVAASLVVAAAGLALIVPFAIAYLDASIATRLERRGWSVTREPPWLWIDRLLPAPLRWVGLRATSVTAPTSPSVDDLALVKRLGHLEAAHFWITTDPMPDGPIDDIIALPRLVRFTAAFPIDEEVWNRLLAKSELEYLDCAPRSVPPAALARIGSLRQLRYLELGHVTMDDATIAGLGQLDRLHDLVLRRCAITSERIASLVRALPRLYSLDLSHTAVAADGLATLAEAGGLRSLKLRGVPLDEESVRALSLCVNLSDLDVSDTGITDEMVTAFLRLPGLSSISLSGCDIGPASLDAMRASTARWIYAHRTRCTTEMATILRKESSRRLKQTLFVDHPRAK